MEKNLKDLTKRRKLEKGMDDLRKGEITRRSFIKAGLALGFSGGLLGTLAKETLGEEPLFSPWIDEKKVQEEGELNLYFWGGFNPPKLFQRFEDHYGIKINFSGFPSSPEMFAKFQRRSWSDVFYPTSMHLGMSRERGLLRPIDFNVVRSIENVDPFWMQGWDFDPEKKYGVPAGYGDTSMYWNENLVPFESQAEAEEILEKGLAGVTRISGKKPNSSATMWDQKLANKLTMTQNPDSTYSQVLNYLGYSINSLNENEYKEATKLLMIQKPILRAYINYAVRAPAIRGELAAFMTWNDVGAAIVENNPNIHYCLVKEGVSLWLDYFAVPDDAPHPYTAMAFLEYLCHPWAAAQIPNYVRGNTCLKLDLVKPYLDSALLENPALLTTPAAYKEHNYTGLTTLEAKRETLELRKEGMERVRS